MNPEETNNEIVSDYVSITPSGFFGDSVDNIVAIEDFMTEEELLILNKFARSNKTWDVTETHYNEDGTVIYDSGYWDHRVATAPIIEKVAPEVAERAAPVTVTSEPAVAAAVHELNFIAL